MSDNSEKGGLYARNSSFEILLFKAAKDGNVMQCKELMSRGVDIDITNKDGSTPLFEAAREGHIGVCELFLVLCQINSPLSGGAAFTCTPEWVGSLTAPRIPICQ